MRQAHGRSTGWRLGLGALMALGAAACSGDTPTGGGGGGGGGRTYVTTYTVTASGDGQIAQVQYNNGLGNLIPATVVGSAWTTQVNMNPGDKISLVVTGTATNGDIVATMSSDDGVGSVVGDSDTCTASGTATNCDLQLPVQSLP